MNTPPRMSATTHAHDDEPQDTIASRFERLAAHIPDNLALITPEVSLTYRELDGLAGRMAAQIEALAPYPARPVGLLMREGALLYAAMIGAAKARRIFIPFETTISEERLSRLIALSGACHVLADDRNGDAAKRAAGPVTNATVLSLDKLPKRRGGAAEIAVERGLACLYSVHLRLERPAQRRAAQPMEHGAWCGFHGRAAGNPAGRSCGEHSLERLFRRDQQCLHDAAARGMPSALRYRRTGDVQVFRLARQRSGHAIYDHELILQDVGRFVAGGPPVSHAVRALGGW